MLGLNPRVKGQKLSPVGSVGSGLVLLVLVWSGLVEFGPFGSSWVQLGLVGLLGPIGSKSVRLTAVGSKGKHLGQL